MRRSVAIIRFGFGSVLVATLGAVPANRAAEAAPPRVKVAVVTLAERPEDVAGLARVTPLPLDGSLRLCGGTVGFRGEADGTLYVDADGRDGAEVRVVERRPVSVGVRREGGEPVALALAFERNAGGWTYRVASALRLSAGDRTVVLVDCDGDGSATGAADGVLPAGEAPMAPLRSPLLAHDARWTLAGADLGRPRAPVTVEPLAPPGKGVDALVAETLARVNRFRRRTGLPEVALDPVLSVACAKHHVYVKTNGFDPRGRPHEEDPAKPGYTAAGYAAAVASNLMDRDGPDAVDVWIRTYYHRAPFMVPGCERIGIATGGGFTVLDLRSGVAPAPYWRTAYVRSPAPGELDVPPAFWIGEEVPCPVPRCGARGFPVAILGLPGPNAIPRPQGVALSSGRRPVPVPALAPGPDPTTSYMLLGGTIPETPLASGTYEASFTPLPGQSPVRWTFSVGK